MADRSEMGVSYWVGHAIVIVSTVIGVYLAASVGFQKAVEFELLKSDRDTYYLAHAYHNEVIANAEVAEAFAKEFNGKAYFAEQNRPRFNRYVYETMKFAPSTFEIRPQILNAVAQYYSDVDDLINKLDARKLGKQVVLQRLNERSAEIKSTALAMLAEDVEAMKKRLNDSGIKP